MRTKHRRNRRKRVNGYAARVPLAVFVAVALMLIIGMLWLKAGSDALGAEISRLERVSQDLTEQLLNEEMKWNRMQSARNISTVLTRSGIRMDWPASGQVVRMQDARRDLLADQDLDWDAENRYAGVGRTGRHE